MKKTTIKVPLGIKYISEFKDLYNNIPTNGHYILNKKVCGCGATELYLGCDKKCILASPRKNLLYNKYSQHLSDNFHLFRYNGDKDKYFSNGSISSSETVTYKENLRDYIKNGGTKILITYDSIRHTHEILQDEKQDIEEWEVIVDEFQVMFYDCHFKATTEYEFYKHLQSFPNVVFLSATPFLEEYLDQLDFFKNMTMYELEWPRTMVEKPKVNMTNTSKTITKLCEGIIDKYRNGKGETTLVDGKEYRSKEAILYINSVKDIVKVIKALNINPEEVNIICSSTPENISKLKELSKAIGMEYKIGDIPGKGDTHKMFTFCTSTVYVGADFYSDNAYTYIFANPKVESLTIDVSVDIQQIIGRQRLDSNPFKNMATLYFNTKASDMTEEAFNESIRLKNEKTNRQIENFNSAPHKEDFIEGLNKKPNHKENYCCISKDEKGNQVIEKNTLIELAERRAWEISNKIFNNDLSMFTALSVNMNVTKDTDCDDSEVKVMFQKWNEMKSFKDRAFFYCEACKDIPEVLDKCSFIPTKYKEYYEALGEEGMKKLGWREDYIKNTIAPIPFEQRPNDKIMEKLRAKLEIGKFYTKTEIKELLCNIFKELGLKGKPSASDISFYIDCEEKSKRMDGKKVVGYQVISHYKKRVSLFKRITDVKNPINYNLDDILEMIRTGTEFDLKKKVQDVRNAKDKDEKDSMKIRIPAVTVNGIFESKNKNCLLVYSSYTALDFDHIPEDEMSEFIDNLKKSPHVYAGFRTSSGEGYKAIILHDNLEPLYHDDLYEQLLTYYNCEVKDTSTRDLARGNYLSYDPDLWINPDAEPFHFVPSTSEPKTVAMKTETVIKTEAGEEILVQDDDEASGFLLKLRKQVISDETIIKFLKDIWTGKAIGQGRNNAAMSYAGVLCKAGIEKNKAKELIEELIPGFDISEIIRYAYSHNIYGCERRRYIRKKKD
ncbi:MAG TPA: hypothetical protein OIM39_03795 [Bacteroidaceae bacterium]|nr:hypothetical protein [Bacteroidaceae bacterium]